MQGQKQIFTLVVILIVICTFTFFRNAIRKDNQIKHSREEALRKKHESVLEDSEPMGSSNDLHGIVFKPEKRLGLNDKMAFEENKIGSANKIEDNPGQIAGPILDAKHKNSVVTEPAAYVCVIILIYSFIKAATDMSRQLHKKKEDDDSNLRKFSLQGYAINNKRNRRPSRAPILKRSTTVSVEPRMHAKQQSLEERRWSYINSELNLGSGLMTERGTPPKIVNG